MTSRITGSDPVTRALATRPGLARRLAGLNPALALFGDDDAIQEAGSRITVDDVAHMAGVSSETLLAYVNGEGAMPEPAASPAAQSRPQWLVALDEDALPGIDARPIIAGGTDPFAEVTRMAATIDDGGVFIVDAPFDPAPLRRYLGNRGFASHGEKREDGHWRLFFRREGEGTGPMVGPTVGPTVGKGVGVRFVDGVAHIDVRGLEPPQPLIAVIELIERPETGDEVVVVLDREPMFLLPELAERGWKWARTASPGDGVNLRLSRTERKEGS